MKNFDRIIAAAVILTGILFLCANLFFVYHGSLDGARPYRVEVSRIAKEIEQSGGEISLDGYQYVRNVEQIGKIVDENTEEKEDLISVKFCNFESDSDYLIRRIGGALYRFDYTVNVEEEKKDTALVLNIAVGGMAFLLFGILFYIRFQILLPFNRLVDIPYQLSRGVLINSLKENKNRFFGKFIWGMDLLRERMEEQKRQALKNQKEHETMLSALSHDIKTPLAAIKLYAKALEKRLYKEKEKQEETAKNIGKKADEIEIYVAQLTNTLREDFLSLSVRKGEFYLSVLLQEIKKHYNDPLSLAGIDFLITETADCLLTGDLDRSIEVLQNLIENAIKYGDGKRILLDFSQEENCVLVTVRNSGCTLFDAELPHIFESFWRGSNIGAMPGSGLGLFICRQIMHRMGGEIFAVREGDVFVVTAVFEKAL